MTSRNINSPLFETSEQTDWLNNQASLHSFDIKMSNTDSAQFLTDQTMLNGGESDGIFIEDQILLNQAALLASDFLDPIINGALAFDRMTNNFGFDASDFTIALAEIQQHLSSLHIADGDFAAAAQLHEAGFSPRPDYFALTHM